MQTNNQAQSERPKLRRKFTPEEDQKLMAYVQYFGEKWSIISKLMETRTCKQCRERYREYLNPRITNAAWTKEEDELLIRLYTAKGPRWAEFSKILNGRSDNNIKNRWHTYLKHKVDTSILQSSSTEVSDTVSPEDLSEIISIPEPQSFEFHFVDDFEFFYTL